MLIRKLKDCREVIAGDSTRLRELLHPDRDYQFHGRYSLAHALVPPEGASLKHKLKSDEVYFILSGQGEMHVDGETADVEVGDAIEVPPNSLQWIENTADVDLVFLCAVDPAWRREDEEVLE